MTDLTATGSSKDKSTVNRRLGEGESVATKFIHDKKKQARLVHQPKAYPQRHNRTKLNYRDLERGMYENIRQSDRNTASPRTTSKKQRDDAHLYIYIDDSSDDDHDDRMPVDQFEDKVNENIDQLHRHFWCTCKKPHGQLRTMLRCDSCAHWYHGDCIGLSTEQARLLKLNGEQLVCPTCRGTLPVEKSSPSDEKLSPKKLYKTARKSTVRNLRQKSAKPVAASPDASSTETQSYCIVLACPNWAQADWVYCSSDCIRLHINESLKAIQRRKGVGKEELPKREDILLYDSRTQKTLEERFVPNVEDLGCWLNAHPSYEIIKPTSRKAILQLASEQQEVVTSPSPTTPPTPVDTKKSIPKKTLVKLRTNHPMPAACSIAVIRSKVPTALYDKLIMRLEKSGETPLEKEKIRSTVSRIEEEMFRVYESTDNAYKNKFRSLLANISNMNNDFFYKQILSNEWTAEQIVAMTAKDMLPPEEKEKRKDEFDREVQLIMQAEAQHAQEMARRARLRGHRQDLIDDSTTLLIPALLEPILSKESVESLKVDTPGKVPKTGPTKQTSPTEILDFINSVVADKAVEKTDSNNKQPPTPKGDSPVLPQLPSPIETVREAVAIPPTLATPSLIKERCREITPPNLPAVDLDNDYIEPESPTGADALIYDEEDEDGDNISSISASPYHQPKQSTNDDPSTLPHPSVARDDYNPSKLTQASSASACSTTIHYQWHGTIALNDQTIACQSAEVYGENLYLTRDVPDRLTILGRLRIVDVWHFVRESLAVRDVLIIKLVPSSTSNTDQENFSRNVQTMRSSGRAIVITKRTDTSCIRDMYILPADRTDCPSNVVSTFSLHNAFNANQLFHVVVGSARRTSRGSKRSSTASSRTTLKFKPVATQSSTVNRDPRLLKNKTAEAIETTATDDDIIILDVFGPLASKDPRQTPAGPSNEDLRQLIAETLEKVRQSSSVDDISSLVVATMKVLKTNKRGDLCTDFTNDLHAVMAEWQSKRIRESIVPPVTGDNFKEENMDVDDAEEPIEKESIVSTTRSETTGEFNDVDERYVVQDANRCFILAGQEQNRPPPERKRKSRFSDISPKDRLDEDHPRTRPFNQVISKETVVSDKQRTTTYTYAPSTMLTSRLADKTHLHSSLNDKFRPLINVTPPFVLPMHPSSRFPSKPIRFSFSKDPLRRSKPNLASVRVTTKPNVQQQHQDKYEDNPALIEELIQQVQTYGYQNLSFQNSQWSNDTLPIVPLRTEAMVNLVLQQQKTRHRAPSHTREWRSTHANYISHYHDFDRPED